MTTIYDELRDSHATQRRLCNSLVRTRAKNPTRRRLLLGELRIELAAHAAAEERYLYVPILMHDLGLNSARHALSEHHDLDERVEALQTLDPAGDAWTRPGGRTCAQGPPPPPGGGNEVLPGVGQAAERRPETEIGASVPHGLRAHAAGGSRALPAVNLKAGLRRLLREHEVLLRLRIEVLRHP